MIDGSPLCRACGETTDFQPTFGTMHVACVKRLVALGQADQQVRHERNGRVGEEPAHFDA